MKIKFTTVALSAALLSTLVVGCKKDEKTVPVDNTETANTTTTGTTTETETQTVSLKMDAYVGSSPLNYSSSFTTSSGIKHTISTFRYYVSNIRLIKSDGSEYPITDKYFLVSPSTSNYSLGEVPVGDYKGLKFNVGIDSLTNHQDPTIYSASNPLAIQSPGMHWNWNSGYIFIMVEGTCDTTVANTDVLTLGQYSKGMFLHIGMDKNNKEVDLSTSPFTVSAAAESAINIKADLDTFFNGIDLKTDNQTHTMDNMPLAMKATANIPNMFTVIP